VLGLLQYLWCCGFVVRCTVTVPLVAARILYSKNSPFMLTMGVACHNISVCCSRGATTFLALYKGKGVSAE
jgi:hypothetical protein